MKKLLPLITLILASFNINSFAAQVDLNGNLVGMPAITSNHISYEETSLGPYPYPSLPTGGGGALGETVVTPGGWLETSFLAI